MISMPVFAKNENLEKDKIIDAQFKTDLNVNKASKGQIVQFVSSQEYKMNDITLPAGTVFSGEIKNFKKGRWGYRRAKAVIEINKIILPDGKTYNTQTYTQKHVLKGSPVANTAKGVITFPLAIAVGAAGTAVIVAEAISIVGILIIGPTTYGIGRAMGGLTHGINYKKQEGDEIKLKIKSISM